MSIRVNKVLKELNIGINDMATYLMKIGQSLIDAAPNAKLSDEQYNALVNHFTGKLVMSISQFAESKGDSDIADVIRYAHSKGLMIPNDPSYVLSSEELSVIDPIHYKSQRIKETISSKPKQESVSKNFFRTKTETKANPISVLGSINLDALNSSTRPQRKTREQRQEERARRNAEQSPNVATQRKNTDTTIIRDIWQRFHRYRIYRS